MREQRADSKYNIQYISIRYIMATAYIVRTESALTLSCFYSTKLNLYFYFATSMMYLRVIIQYKINVFTRLVIYFQQNGTIYTIDKKDSRYISLIGKCNIRN